jgi:hypothetical protein
MPFFKSTHNILNKPWEDEVFNENWMNSNKLVLPPGGPDDPKFQWDYERELRIEDVDIWEQIYCGSGNLGLYASWCPYAEFYLITTPCWWEFNKLANVETYYGPGSAEKAYQRAIQLGMPIVRKEIWVDDSELWLFAPQKDEKTIDDKKIILI